MRNPGLVNYYTSRTAECLTRLGLGPFAAALANFGLVLFRCRDDVLPLREGVAGIDRHYRLHRD